MPEVVIPYKQRDAFRAFHAMDKRWAILVCHRAAGKSVALVNHFIRAALIKQQGVFSLISPTYTQAKRTLWPILHQYGDKIPGVAFNEAELRVNFPSGSRLYLLGSDNPDALRGIHQHGCGLDEYQHHPQTLFGEIIVPTLTTHNGFCIFAGTVKTKGNIWKLWNEKREDPTWYTLFLRASESGIFTPEQLAVARSNMTQEQYDQEYELEPLAYLEGAIFGDEMRWLRKNGHIRRLEPSAFAQIDTYWDFGVADYTVIWFVEDMGNEAHVLDCYATHNKSLEDIAMRLRKMPFTYRTHYLPHDARKRTDITLETRQEYLDTNLPGRTEVVPRPASKLYAIDAFKWAHKRLHFDDRMDVAISALEQWQRRFDEKNNVFLQEPQHSFESHYCDSAMLIAQVMREKHQEREASPKQSPIYGGSDTLVTFADDGGFVI